MFELCLHFQVICVPDFDDFPFNRHTCHVNVSSWTKTSDHLVFVANKTLVPMSPAEMILFDYGLTVDYVTGKGHGVSNPNDVYSVVGLELKFHMKWTRYIFLYYIPTGLIVITSWIFFLLPSTSYPARTALLVTVFLLLINIFSGVVNDTPNTNDGQMTDLEFWTFMCIVSVFLSLLSYGVILIKDQMIIQGVVMNEEGEMVEDFPTTGKEAWKDDQNTGTHDSIMMKNRKNVLLEGSLFCLVSIFFAIFNLFYWTKSRKY